MCSGQAIALLILIYKVWQLPDLSFFILRPPLLITFILLSALKVLDMLSLLLFAALALTAPLEKRQAPSGVPAFAVTYAPVAYLHSQEQYFPSDIGSQLAHTEPRVNYTLITNISDPLSLDNLDQLNQFGRGGQDVYLTSVDDIETNPVWLDGVKPDSNGLTDGAISSAVIVNDHKDGVVDVFYFYFYAYDFGGVYFNRNIGNHVGDWEYTMVRFRSGKPKAIWYSQHSNGQAFKYPVVEKYNGGSRVRCLPPGV